MNGKIIRRIINMVGFMTDLLLWSGIGYLINDIQGAVIGGVCGIIAHVIFLKLKN